MELRSYRDWKSKVQVLSGLVSGETFFCNFLCAHSARESNLCSFFHFLWGHQSYGSRAPPVWPHLTLIITPKALSLNYGLGLQQMNWGGGAWQHMTQSITEGSKHFLHIGIHSHLAQLPFMWFYLPPIPLNIGTLWHNRFPWWLSGKESACQCRKHKFNPSVGKNPWRRKWQPTPVFLPGKSHRQRSLVGNSPWVCEVRHDLGTKQTLWHSMWTH